MGVWVVGGQGGRRGRSVGMMRSCRESGDKKCGWHFRHAFRQNPKWCFEKHILQKVVWLSWWVTSHNQSRTSRVSPRRTARRCSKFWQVCFRCSNRASLSLNFLLLLSFLFIYLLISPPPPSLSHSFLFQASIFSLASGSECSLTPVWRLLGIVKLHFSLAAIL